MPRKIWFYVLGPVILFNTIPVCLFGAVFAIAYGRGGDPKKIDLTQPLFWLYLAVFLINWLLTIFVFQKYGRAGEPVRRLFAADGEIFRFRWKPALVMFVLFNGIWVIYVLAYEWLAGGWPSYSGFQDWQKIIFIGVFPISAGLRKNCIGAAFLSLSWKQPGRCPKAPSCFHQSGSHLYMASSSRINYWRHSCSVWLQASITPGKGSCFP